MFETTGPTEVDTRTNETDEIWCPEPQRFVRGAENHQSKFKSGAHYDQSGLGKAGEPGGTNQRWRPGDGRAAREMRHRRCPTTLCGVGSGARIVDCRCPQRQAESRFPQQRSKSGCPEPHLLAVSPATRSSGALDDTSIRCPRQPRCPVSPSTANEENSDKRERRCPQQPRYRVPPATSSWGALNSNTVRCPQQQHCSVPSTATLFGALNSNTVRCPQRQPLSVPQTARRVY